MLRVFAHIAQYLHLCNFSPIDFDICSYYDFIVSRKLIPFSRYISHFWRDHTSAILSIAIFVFWLALGTTYAHLYQGFDVIESFYFVVSCLSGCGNVSPPCDGERTNCSLEDKAFFLTFYVAVGFPLYHCNMAFLALWAISKLLDNTVKIQILKPWSVVVSQNFYHTILSIFSLFICIRLSYSLSLIYLRRTAKEFAYAQKILTPYESVHTDDPPDPEGTLGLADFLVCSSFWFMIPYSLRAYKFILAPKHAYMDVVLLYCFNYNNVNTYTLCIHHSLWSLCD